MNQELNNDTDSDMLDEYDFSNGIRGKYVDRLAKGTNVVLLDPDVAEVFTDSESVNQALRALIRKQALEKAVVSGPYHGYRIAPKKDVLYR